MSSFDLQLDKVIEWINANRFTSVAVQLPEGLKSKAMQIYDVIKGTGVPVILIGDPCYGACDLDRGGAEALVHFGHSPIPSQDDGGNVLYIEARANIKIDDIPLNGIPESIGLLATVQYLDLIPQVKDILESSGRTVKVSEGDARICYPGQVLGCNCSSAGSMDDADALLFIGEGDFHPLTAAFTTDKDVFVLNPITMEVKKINDVRDRILRRRFASITSAKEANTFLVILCTKSGQRRDIEASKAVKMIEDAGKKAYTISLNEISPERLEHYDVDAYVNTACPRIAMDDSVRYRRPMLTPVELEIVLGIREWDDYVFDMIR